MAYRLLPSLEPVETVACIFERGFFTYTPLFPHLETTRALMTCIRANIQVFAELFFTKYGYWPSRKDPRRELNRFDDRARYRGMPRLIDVAGGQGVWIIPDSPFQLCLAASLVSLTPLSFFAVGKCRDWDAVFLMGPLSDRELSLLQDGYFPSSLRKIGMPGYDFGPGMISCECSAFTSLVPAIEHTDFDGDFSSFTSIDAGPQRSRHQGEASRPNTRKPDQREGGQTREPPARDGQARYDQDDDENDDEYEIDDQPHRPQRRKTRRAHSAHNTDDELDEEEELRPTRNTTRAIGAGRSAQRGGTRRAHDTDNELDSGDNLQPRRNATRTEVSRRPHDSENDLDRDGRLRPTRTNGARGTGGVGRSTPLDVGRSTFKGPIRDNGYKGKVDDEDEEPPAYEDLGGKGGKGPKGYRSGRTAR